jgi:putative PIN family toxin of toxin-antitoxin system
MPKFVVDTNIWVMSLTSRSEYHSIYLALVARKFEMAVSHDILLEYEEIITEKYGERTAQNFIDLLYLLPNVHFVQSHFHWHLITADEDDDKYVDTYVAAGADTLVSEDGHFNILEQTPFPKVTRIRIDDFLALVKLL